MLKEIAPNESDAVEHEWLQWIKTKLICSEQEMKGPVKQRMPNAEIFRPAAGMSTFMVAWKTVNMLSVEDIAMALGSAYLPNITQRNTPDKT